MTLNLAFEEGLAFSTTGVGMMMGFRMVERKSSSLIDGANWTYMQNYKTLVREGVGHLACSHLASLSFALKQSIRAADHPLHNPETLVHQAAHNMSD